MTSRTLFGFAAACIAAALAPLWAGSGEIPASADAFPGWPTSFENRTLTQLPLSPLEEQFQKNFPGRVGRFTDGKREVILRWVAQETRKLHPGSDCFKANGYALQPQAIKLVGTKRWSGFTATRGKQKFMVHERIYDQAGAQWGDVSAWYWAVQLGQSAGPWWAVTVAQTVEN